MKVWNALRRALGCVASYQRQVSTVPKPRVRQRALPEEEGWTGFTGDDGEEERSGWQT